MKILIYSDYYKKHSGYAREISNLYPTWLREGHEVAQIGLGFNGLPLDNDIKVYPGDFKGMPNHWASPMIRYAIEDFNPDILFIDQDYYILKHIGFELALPATKTVWWGLSDGEGISFNAIEGVKWIHQHVFHTEFTKKQIKKIYKNIDGEVVYPPVDSKIFHKLGRNKKKKLKEEIGIQDYKVLVHCSRPQERKMIPLLLESFSRMLKVRQDLILILVTGGHKLLNDNDQPTGIMVEEYIRSFNLEHNVVIPLSDSGSPISDKTLNIQYNLADINILVSPEGVGLSLLESASCGVPSVSSAQAGGGEVGSMVGVTIPKGNAMYTYDGIKHYLYEPQNLAETVLELLGNDKKLKKLSEKASVFAKSITPENQAKKLLKVFEKVLKDDKRDHLWDLKTL